MAGPYWQAAGPQLTSGRGPTRRRSRRCRINPVGMSFLYLRQIAATNFIRASVRRHFKNAPPLAFFRLLRDPLTLSPSLRLALLLLLGRLLALGRLFCAGPAWVNGPTLGIAFRFPVSGAKENSPCKEKLNTLHGQRAYYYCAS